MTCNIGAPIMLAMDWKKLISDLQAHGLTQAEIGKKVNAAQPTICDIAHGRITDPRFSVGDRLRSLHRRVTASARAKPSTQEA